MISKPKFKIGRRLGAGVFDKCQTQKFVMSQARRSAKRSEKRPKALSEYGQQLVEKQKIRFSYGITERQLSNYVKEASLVKGSVQDHLFELLETRLDNVVYRLGLASSRRLARQMVSHGHIVMNGKRVTVPSARVSIGDVVSVREGSRSSKLFTELETRLGSYKTPDWLTFDVKKIEAKITAKPKNTETFITIGSVLEFYSR